MNDQSVSYEELKRRLASAEGALKALRGGQVDTISGEHGTLVVRLAEAEARADHIKQVLQTIRGVNQLIISEDDPIRLIERACTSLTMTTGYFNAWIVLFTDGIKTPTAVATSGLNNYSNGLEKQLRIGIYTDCMYRTLDQDEIIVVEDPTTECKNCSLSNDYCGCSRLSRRLHYGGKNYGILSVSVPSTFAHDQEEQVLFEEVACNLAFALRKIEAAKELRDNQIDLKRAQLLAKMGSWRIDLKTRRFLASEEAQNIFGLEKTELTTEAVQRIALPQYREKLDSRLNKLIKDGTPYDIEFQIRRPSDNSIHHIHSVAEYDAERDIVIGTIQDITERKNIEEDIRARERYLHTILQTTMDGFWIIDVQGVLIECNQSYCTMSGYSRNELLGKNIEDLDARDDSTQITARMRLIIENGFELFETTHCRKDGSIWPVEVSATWLNEDGGRFICFCRDLSERKKAEAILKESESRYLTLFNNINHGIAIYRPADDGKDFIFVNMNEAGRRISRLEKKEVIGKRLMDLFPNIEASGFLSALQQVHESGIAFNVPDFYYQDDVRHGWRKNFVYKLPSNELVSIFEDITAERLAEAEKVKLQEKIVQSQKMDSIGRLAGGVAHDFNNMLGVILGYSEMGIEQVEKDHPIISTLLEIRKAAKRSADLTKQLLAFARKQTATPKILDLNTTIESMLVMLRRLIGENIDLLWLPGKELSLIKIDPSQIDQILANLCVNSRDSIHDTGRITIETANVVVDEIFCAGQTDIAPGKYVQLALSDNGSGMGPEILSHLFEPFFTTKAINEGTGLGLAMIYGIVKQNHGAISVYSEPRLGTTFKIYLPSYEPKVDQAQEIDDKIAVKSGHETILLVEDEPMILEMTTVMLQRLGYTILPAATPGLALRLASEHVGEIQMIMTDVIMPEMNGIDLARKLSSLYPNIKFLFMSGYTANVIAPHGVLEEGMNFIHKPFSKKELSTKIRNVFERDLDSF